VNKANETEASRFLRLRRWLFGTSLGRVTTLIVVALGLTGVGVLGWLTLPLVISPTVDEAFPPAPVVTTPDSGDALIAAPETAVVTDSDSNDALVGAPAPVVTTPGDSADSSAAPAGFTALFAGEFVGSDDFHRSSGTATIYEGADGSRFLRFEDFSVTNGPRLVVWLSDLTELTSIRPDVGSEPENYFHLQSLTAPNGNQNYTIPATVDLSRYNSVLIWCAPFRIAFAIAPLTPSG